MIKQAYVQAGDKPEPALKEIKDRIATAVDATEGSTGLKRLACWLQMPVDSAFGKMMDSNCQARAKEVGALLSGKDGLFTPADLGSVLSAPAAWTGIDKALKAGSAVYVNGPADHVGGAQSKFTSGFHVIVFLAVGKDADGSVYYLGLDPDVSATAESRAAWKALVAGEPETKPEEFTPAKSLGVVKSMILGDGDTAFGPLLRKYYVDTTAKFPKIKRFV
ncbi:hypothetical protein Slala03_71620 [Streptomyces lavendulae subsp. lavendulae]|uniref:hypothetical protein n=1 Tax=Streptomyces lavendulae TaxID=1914 RepID=UPI0024A2229C|nr:hypothetical protein [Streptomyces lavendulae]GLV87473.1 hypothetical protein Slala03_71620 [Streptomyces lavendulae subsp. lavendulae]